MTLHPANPINPSADAAFSARDFRDDVSILKKAR